MKNTNAPQHRAVNPFYNVMTTEGSDEATIFIYNYIGDWYEWDPEVGYKNVGIRDTEFVKEFETLSAKYKTIHLRINSSGGEVFHGSAICTAIRNCTTAEVHTWLDGIAASMAGVIWMCGHKRHAAKNAMLMLHSASNLEWGNAADMRRMAETLDKFDESLAISAADAVGMDEKEMRAKYFDYQDHWLNYNDILAEGWIEKEEKPYASADPLPTDLAGKPYRELVAYYQAKQNTAPKASDEEPRVGVMSELKKIFEEAKDGIREILNPSSSSLSNDNSDMNFEDFKASLADGKLLIDEVKAHLESLTPPPPAAPAVDENAQLRETITNLGQQLTALESRITALGAEPGAGKSAPGMPGQDHPNPGAGQRTTAQLLEEENQKLLAAARSGEAVRFVPAVPQ